MILVKWIQIWTLCCSGVRQCIQSSCLEAGASGQGLNTLVYGNIGFSQNFQLWLLLTTIIMLNLLVIIKLVIGVPPAFPFDWWVEKSTGLRLPCSSVWPPLIVPLCVVAALGVPESIPDRGCEVVVLPDLLLAPENRLSTLVLGKEISLCIT